MYTTILYFIIVFTVFGIYQSSREPFESTLQFSVCVAGIYLLFYLFCRRVFAVLEKRFEAHDGTKEFFSAYHSKTINLLTLAAIGLYALIAISFNARIYLSAIFLFGRSDLFLNVSGILLFIVFLIIIWRCSFPVYHRFYDLVSTLRDYIESNLRLVISIVTPWVFFSAILDLIKLLPPEVNEFVARHDYLSYVFFVFFLVIFACVFPWLLIRIWNCRPLENSQLRESIEVFSQSAGVEFARIASWNIFRGKIITAGVVGFIKKFRYLLISPTLVEILNEHEIKSVAAHEIGHVRKRHMVFYILFVVGYMFFSYLFFRIFYFGVLSSDLFLNIFFSESLMPNTAFYIFPVLIILCFLILYFRFVFGAFSRNFERQADAYAVELMGSADGIISSLEKIAVAGAYNKATPNWHHYSIQERIDFLKVCDMDRRLIASHGRKVGRMVITYILVLLSAVALFFTMKGFYWDDLELETYQTIITKKIEADPNNPDLYFLLANLEYEREKYYEAERLYQKTITLNPYHADAINNLAWLYSTSKEPDMYRPAEALSLALKAADLKPAPYILDTLAESYYINGYYKKAVETINRAIEQNPDNITYYKSQLKKFEDAARKEEMEKNGSRIAI